jgi:chloride channel 3/4/5
LDICLTDWYICDLILGTISGLIAGYINISAEWLSDIKEGYCSHSFYLKYKFCCQFREENCPEWISWDQNWILGYFLFTLFAVSFGLLSALFVSNFAPYAAGSGIPEVKTILGGFVIRNFLSLSTLSIKVVSLILAVASGMALGKEGPLVHVACCVGQIVPCFFKKYAGNEAKRREMLSVASATGVSVAFGAPIGGVIFLHIY